MNSIELPELICQLKRSIHQAEELAASPGRYPVALGETFRHIAALAVEGVAECTLEEYSTNG